MGIMSLERVEIIQKYLKEQGSVAVAFSGGVDSTFLLYIAKEALGLEVFPGLRQETLGSLDLCR